MGVGDSPARKARNQKEHAFGNALRYRLYRQSELYLARHGKGRAQVEIRNGYAGRLF